MGIKSYILYDLLSEYLCSLEQHKELKHKARCQFNTCLRTLLDSLPTATYCINVGAIGGLIVAQIATQKTGIQLNEKLQQSVSLAC